MLSVRLTDASSRLNGAAFKISGVCCYFIWIYIVKRDFGVHSERRFVIIRNR